MISIDKTNVNYISNIMLHDAELKTILCNYEAHDVAIAVNIYKPKIKPIKAELLFNNVLHLDVGIYEPWGAGKYIVEVNIEQNDPEIPGMFTGSSEHFRTTILLNSGDKINIVSSIIIYLEH